MATIAIPIESRRRPRQFGPVTPADGSATGCHRYQTDTGQQYESGEVEKQHPRHEGSSRTTVVSGEAAIATAM